MIGEGRSYNYRKIERVHCPKCRKDLVRGSLAANRQTQNGVAKWGLGQKGDREGGGKNPMTLRMEFPTKAGPRPFPVEGCSGQAATRTDM